MINEQNYWIVMSSFFLTLSNILHQLYVFSEFLPGAGPLIHLSTPSPASDVRIDTGVRQGKGIGIRILVAFLSCLCHHTKGIGNAI